MNGSLQSRIAPAAPPAAVELSKQAVKSNVDVVRGEGAGTDFRSLLTESNANLSREREAKAGVDDLSSAKTEEEFFEKLRQNADPNKPKPPTKEMDKDAFLKLFIAQLQNQDPLQPKDSSEMASQMAQFQGLESSMNINKTLEKMLEADAKQQSVNLVDFVGKEVNIEGGRLKVEGGKLQEAVMTMERDAVGAEIEVRDTTGAVIATQPLGALSRGKQLITWDGLGKDGERVADGVYTFSVVAKDLNQMPVPVKISSSVKITGVDMQKDGGSFYTDLGRVEVSDVASVGSEGFMKAEINKMKQAASSAEDKPKEADVKAAPLVEGAPEKAAPLKKVAEQGEETKKQPATEVAKSEKSAADAQPIKTPAKPSQRVSPLS